MALPPIVAVNISYPSDKYTTVETNFNTIFTEFGTLPSVLSLGGENTSAISYQSGGIKKLKNKRTKKILRKHVKYIKNRKSKKRVNSKKYNRKSKKRVKYIKKNRKSRK